jgi:xylose isomerase
MATTNLFGDPVFRDGAFTSVDANVRRHALQKTMRAMDLGKEFGAETYVFWGGREGTETNASKDPQEGGEVVPRCAQLPVRVLDRAGLRLQVRAGAEAERAARRHLPPDDRHALAIIYTLDHPEMVGLNPEIAHDTMAGLEFTHGVAQALEAGKLFHIDLNAQKPGRYDQDHRFGSEDPKAAFFLVKLLEDSKWPGMRHFDSHAYRTEDQQGVWDFAAGSMRTYLILKRKVGAVQRRHRDPGLLGRSPARSKDVRAQFS